MARKSRDLVIGEMFHYWRVLRIENKGRVLCECTGCLEVTKFVHRTNLIRGVSRSCGCKNNEIKQATNMTRFGVPYLALLPEIKEKIGRSHKENKERITEKRKKTMKEKYGVECITQLKERIEEIAKKSRKQFLKGETKDLWEVLEDRNENKTIKCICRGCNQTIKQLTVAEFLRGGRSCGCLTKKDRVVSRIEKNKELGLGPKIFKGDKFGFWEVLEDYKNDRKIKCICTGCNINIKELSPHDLIDLKTKSCGCKKMHHVTSSLLGKGKFRVMTSKGQLAIYNCLKNNNYDVQLNWPILRYNADISLKRKKVRLVIEYDGSGHFLHIGETEGLKKDAIRDQRMIGLGYKILRFVSKKDKIPSDQFILGQVNRMLESDLLTDRVNLDILSI